MMKTTTRQSILITISIIITLFLGIISTSDKVVNALYTGKPHTRMNPKNPRVEDRLAIEELISHYTDIIDGKRFEELEGIFTKDAVIDYTMDGEQLGGGAKGLVPKMVKWLHEEMGSRFPKTLHVASNILIEFDAQDERRAYVTAKLFNPMCMRGFPVCPMFTIMGHYHHVVVKDDDGVWRSISLKESEIHNDVIERVVILLLTIGFLARYAFANRRG